MTAWRAPRIGTSWLPVAALAGLALAILAMPPIAQPPQYHDFADQRVCFGLPNCLDTASNALFVLAGLLGLRFLLDPAGRRVFEDAREIWPYALFFLAVILVGLASGRYHFAPDNGGLAWDRAAIALALMACASVLRPGYVCCRSWSPPGWAASPTGTGARPGAWATCVPTS